MENAMNGWYAGLKRPWLTPPDWVFAPVWTILYLMIALSMFLFLKKYRSQNGYGIYLLMVLHLISNFAWTGLFFGMKAPGLALLDILFMDLSLWFMAWFFWKTDRASSVLLWPYMLWLLFATYLNASFYLLNRG
jgi:tryptophan-rich sensory protein